MARPTLFSFEDCMKCEQAKKLLDQAELDVDIITLSHDATSWNEGEKNLVEEHDVFHSLLQTAPILTDNNTKYVGYLRIKKWINER